jgi:hypothetical protein
MKKDLPLRVVYKLQAESLLRGNYTSLAWVESSRFLASNSISGIFQEKFRFLEGVVW